MAKAQMVGQIFIYLLSIAMVAIVLVFGYKSVTNFKDQAEKAALLQLKNDITNSIDGIMTEYGTVKKKTIQMGDFDSLCFVDEDAFSTNPTNLQATDTDPVIAGQQKITPFILNSIIDKSNNNVFLMKGRIPEPVETSPLDLDRHVLCIPAVGNAVHLRLEGGGDHVKVSAWTLP